MEQTGWIETSNPKLNRLFLNTLWSQKDNSLDIPTDCRQRDERIGWSGDVTCFCETANQHMYTPAFFNHYLKCLRHEQLNLKGKVPLFAPAPKDEKGVLWLDARQGSSVWGDVGAVLPYSLWVMYGDKSMLRNHYPLIRDWADWLIHQDQSDHDQGLRQKGFHWGDWLALDTPYPSRPLGATNSFYIATAFYWNTIGIAMKTAEILGVKKDHQRFKKRHQKIRKAFIEEYFDAHGNLTIPETQTALALALYFRLFPDGMKSVLLARLLKRIEKKGNHTDCGFTGTSILPLVLSRYSRDDMAYSLLLQEQFPSWLFEVNLNATTIWEKWNSLAPNGIVTPTTMNSLNHFAFGSIGNWMYRYMCGLNPMEDSVGYKKVVICPRTDPRVQHVSMVRDTAAGRYEIEWKYLSDKLHFVVVVPFDCEALITLPRMNNSWVGAGSYEWTISVDLH
jgi:alpha-L-rhamnosidase